MEKYGVFDINDVSVTNLSAIDGDASRSFELRLCEMSFVSESTALRIGDLLSDGMSITETFAILAEEICASLKEEKPLNVMKEAISAVKVFRSILSAADKANFSALLLEKLLGMEIAISEADFLPQSNPGETFAYVKSALADEAFDVFSQEFSDPRVFYAETFKEACIGVADKKYGYCILPFEEKPSVRIPSISKLVSDLDLKIVAITPVFGFEGTADMRYALIGRDFKIPEINEVTDRYLEISIPKDAVSLSELLYVADTFSVRIYNVNTVIDPENSEKSYYSLIFKDGGRSFAELLIYLSLFASEYIPTGIYKNIE